MYMRRKKGPLTNPGPTGGVVSGGTGTGSGYSNTGLPPVKKK
jgi:hypothetical protein